jgi:hypothetical protein
MASSGFEPHNVTRKSLVKTGWFTQTTVAEQDKQPSSP